MNLSEVIFTMKFEYALQGMHCQSCVKKIEDAFKSQDYTNVSVSLHPQQLSFESEKEPDKMSVQTVLSSAGAYTLQNEITNAAILPAEHETDQEDFTPLLVVVGFISGGVLLRALLSGNFAVHTLMINFMGSFFAVFAMFKLFNISAFADAFSSYDLIAMRSRTYALCYPFIELLLGVSYFTEVNLSLLNTVTLLLMVVGGIGVYKALKRKSKIQCACLGTAFKLPMTKVTLIEDFGMALMAFIMLITAPVL